MGYKNRDVEVVFLNTDACLVVACDSCGAIGEKERDVVKVPAAVTGRSTVRVALMEVMASGAIPQIITVAISNEREPTGAQILEGVRQELAISGLENIKVLDSTEKNVPTQQTGLGISVIGSCSPLDLRLGKTEKGDFLYGIGMPKVGHEVMSPDDPEIMQIKYLQALIHCPDIHDLIPAGSKGLHYECEQLGNLLDIRPEYDPDCPIPLAKSAGPSTALLFTSCRKLHELDLKEFDLLPQRPPIYRIGWIPR